MSEKIHDPQLEALEAALAGLLPAAAPIDRDYLMFQAGRSAVRGLGWLWPCASGALAALAAILGAALLLRSPLPPVERTVYVQVPQPSPPVAPETASSTSPRDAEPLTFQDSDGWQPRADYFKLQVQVLRWGLDGLPNPPPASGSEKRSLSDDGLLDISPEMIGSERRLWRQALKQTGGPL